MKNAGKYSAKIKIYSSRIDKASGYQRMVPDQLIISPHAAVKTTRGMTLIQNNSGFEKAYTNFTVRYPKTAVTRDMLVVYRSKVYSIEYMNNVNEEGIELELQCKEITH